jgi:peptide-methionine (S)-S-oxide reductase
MSAPSSHAAPLPVPATDIPASSVKGPQTAIFAGGCFWGVEAVFRHVTGVSKAVSGYAGGMLVNPSYEQVGTGRTGHAESVQVTYDPAVVSYGQLLAVFFSVAHDPTHVNRQGNDRGRQYRSAVFYADEDQRAVAESYIKQLNDAKMFPAPIATTLEPLEKFYQAELYHQNYVERNPNQPYVAAVAIPKVHKLEKAYADKLKKKVP